MSELTIALATGRIAKDTIQLLARANIIFPDYHDKSRKLVMFDQERKLRLILVKTADLTTYVEKGAADFGIVGKDVLMENNPNVYEMVDLNLGACKIAVAGFPNQSFSDNELLTVATKYPNIAKNHFAQANLPVEIIKLNGSIELAPLIGLADVIVDIVETGNTLKENGLVVLEDIAQISARLIVNKASYATKTIQLEEIMQQMNEVLEVIK